MQQSCPLVLRIDSQLAYKAFQIEGCSKLDDFGGGCVLLLTDNKSTIKIVDSEVVNCAEHEYIGFVIIKLEKAMRVHPNITTTTARLLPESSFQSSRAPQVSL